MIVKRYKQSQTDEMANILKKDGVISVPTDTVYGLCARINSIKAYNNLLLAKNRPVKKLFPVMCADEEQIKSIALVDDKAKKLIHAFMPGPITLILKKKSQVPNFVNNGGTTIAVRMATSKALEELIRKTGCPIFMSSANQSGKPTCKSLDEIEKTCPTIDGMMEGEVSFGRASTIIDCTTEEIKILRLGPISMEQIINVIRMTYKKLIRK